MAARPILIDATTAEHARGGIGVVTSGLLEALAAHHRDIDITVLAGPTVPVPSVLKTVRLPLLGSSAARIAFQRLLEPALIALSRRHLATADRLVTLDSYVPAWRWPGRFPRVACFVHDVLPLTHPQFFTARRDAVKRLAFTSIRKQRPEVYTSTDFTAEEIRTALGLEPRVARFGCGQLSDREADAFLAAPPSPRRPFILYVGAVEERKDLRTLVEAFDRVRAARYPDLQLALAGNWRTEEGRTFRRWVAARPESRVRFVGRVDRDAAVKLLTEARALVYPSVAEGFGLPVIEGLAVGTPVVASDIRAVTSWAGEAIVSFPHGDAAALADALSEAIEQPLDRTARRGKDLAEQYRWRNFAAAMVS